MRKLSKLALAFAASFMVFSCSNDEPNGGQGNGATEGDVFATLTLALPQGGRSATDDWDGNDNSNDGYEEGLDKENTVGSVLVILADENYNFITSSVAAAHASTVNTARPTYNVQFQSTALADNAGGKVYVYAICNPSVDMIKDAEAGFNTTEGGFSKYMGNITKYEIWNDNAFLMANASPCSADIPGEDDLKNVYNKETNPFPLGTVEVSRVSARFDFKQTKISGMTADNLYPIYNHANTEGSNKELMGYVQLDKMALLNLANNYYVFPWVSNNADWSDPVLCGRETSTNYVVSPFESYKTADPLSTLWISENYTFSGLTANATAIDLSILEYNNINDLDQDDNANDSTWGGDDQNGSNLTPAEKADYKIWRYITENTIPEVDNQRKSITTGVVFKAHLVAEPNSALATEMAKGGNLYFYDGIIYGGWDSLQKYVKNNPTHPVSLAFKAAAGITENDPEKVNEAIDAQTAFTEATNGIGIYRNVNGEYPVYYPYFNRHNDNGNNTQMGAMEFAVVRNNIYKLKIENVLRFGHTGDPKDDPDPEKPGDPDETPKTYFRLQVKVLPWTVRVNNIIL